MNLQDALQECTLALLRRIAEFHGIRPGDDVLRTELIAQIAERYAAEGYVAERTSALAPEETAVLQYLAEHEWVARAFLLERQFPAGSTQTSPCLALLQKGILFRTYGTLDGWRGELYHVPDDLRPSVKPAVAAGSPAGGARTVRPVAEPAHIEEPRDAALDLFSLLSFLRRADHRSHGGYLSRQDVARLEQEMGRAVSLDSEAALRFMLRLCLGAGWVWRDGVYLRPGRSVDKLLSGGRSAIWRALIDRYTKDRAWSDLAEAGKVRQSLGSRRIDEVAGRHLLLHYLGELAPGGWTEESEFRTALRATNPDFLREDYASLSWAVVDVSAEAEVYGEDSWEIVEGEWISYVLRGPLNWLGVVNWGGPGPGMRLAFSLASWATHQSAVANQDAAGLVLRDDLWVHAPAGCDLHFLYRLEPYMLFRGSETGGRAYRLTAASVHHGLEAGGSVEELTSLLAGATGGAVPEEALAHLRRWAASYGRIVLEGAVLLSAVSEEELAEAERLPGVAECLGERVSGTAVRVLPPSLHRLLSLLHEAGMAPRVDPSTGNLRLRWALGNEALLRESLFALHLVRSLHGSAGLDDAVAAIRMLEAALGPESSDAISRRAQEAARKLRNRVDPAW